MEENHTPDDADDHCGGFMPELAHVYPTHTSDDDLEIHGLNYWLHANRITAQLGFDATHRLSIAVYRCVGDACSDVHETVLRQLQPVLERSYGHPVAEGTHFVLDVHQAQIVER